MLASILLVILAPLSATAQSPQPTPIPGTYVHDFAGVIRPEKKAEIQNKAQRLKDEYKTEIAVVTVNSLNGESSFDYSMRMARSWGIGSPDNEIRGVLIVVAIQDRKTAFRTSRHVEGELPDGITGQISRAMNQYFKGGDFGGGLSAGMDKILEVMKERYEPTQASAPEVATTPEENPFDISGSKLVLLMALPFAALTLVLMGMIFRYVRGESTGSYTDTSDDEERPRRRRYGRRAAEPLHGSHRRASYTPASVQPEPVIYNPPATSETRESDDDYSTGSPSKTSNSDFSLPDFSSPSSTPDTSSTYSGGNDWGGGGTDTSW